MEAFEIDALTAQQAAGSRPYLEFLRVPSMSAGLYVLAAGATDGQKPHNEDELYYIVRGCAMIRVADEDRPVGPGSLVFVAAKVEHRFHSIEEQLEILVFFAPAETV